MYHVTARLGPVNRTILRGKAWRMLLLGIFVGGCVHPTAVERAMGEVRRKNEPAAISILENEIGNHPEDAAARRLLIRLYATSGRLDRARNQVEELLRRTPEGDPSPLIELGHAFELAHKFEEALAAYDEAGVRAPSSPLGPREGGLRAAHWGEAEVAVERLTEAVKRGARDPETFHALGLAKMKLNDLKGAHEAYEHGVAAAPAKIDSLIGLATVALAEKNYAAALDAYDRILLNEPTFASAWLGRAYALIRLGRFEEATASINKAEALGAPKANVEKQRALLRSAAP